MKSADMGERFSLGFELLHRQQLLPKPETKIAPKVQL